MKAEWDGTYTCHICGTKIRDCEFFDEDWWDAANGQWRYDGYYRCKGCGRLIDDMGYPIE